MSASKLKYTTEQMLIDTEERMAHAVCSGFVVSEFDANRIGYLRRKVGKKWDAVNRKWIALDEYDLA